MLKKGRYIRLIFTIFSIILLSNIVTFLGSLNYSILDQFLIMWTISSITLYVLFIREAIDDFRQGEHLSVIIGVMLFITVLAPYLLIYLLFILTYKRIFGYSLI